MFTVQADKNNNSSMTLNGISGKIISCLIRHLNGILKVACEGMLRKQENTNSLWSQGPFIKIRYTIRLSMKMVFLILTIINCPKITSTGIPLFCFC